MLDKYLVPKKTMPDVYKNVRPDLSGGPSPRVVGEILADVLSEETSLSAEHGIPLRIAIGT